MEQSVSTRTYAIHVIFLTRKCEKSRRDLLNKCHQHRMGNFYFWTVIINVDL